MSEPSTYRSSGVAIRRVAQLRRTAITVAVIYALVALGFTLAGGMIAMAGFLAVFAYLGLPFLAHYERVSDPSAQTSDGPLFPGTLRVGASEIVLESEDGVLRAARGDIADGWTEPFGGGGHRVVIRLHSGDLGVVEVEHLQRGHEILSAVGLSADKHALRVRTSGHANQIQREMGLVASLFALCIPLIGLGFARTDGETFIWSVFTAGAAALVGVAARSRTKPVVRVGLDGIEISRDGSKRFIPVKDVGSVHLSVAGVELGIAHEDCAHEVVVLRCWGVQQAALHARIREVVRGFGGDAASAAQLAHLDRQGRDLASWRDALRCVAEGAAGDYRRVGIPRDDLVRLLAQGDQPPERRIAAALALASAGDPGERERVRIAARACASEDLRAALEGIAEDEVDEAVVDAALREPARVRMA